MVDFLYGMNWRRFIEEKSVRIAKIRHFLGRTREWYRYKKVVPVPIMQRSGTGTTQSGTGTHWQKRIGTSTGPSGTGTDASSNPIFACYVLLSPIFVHRLFRDPNK